MRSRRQDTCERHTHREQWDVQPQQRPRHRNPQPSTHSPGQGNTQPRPDLANGIPVMQWVHAEGIDRAVILTDCVVEAAKEPLLA